MFALDAAEWAFWSHVMERTPFGPRQDDLRAARPACATYAVFGASVAPGDMFPSLTSKRSGKADVAQVWAGFASLCPSLTPKSR